LYLGHSHTYQLVAVKATGLRGQTLPVRILSAGEERLEGELGLT